jgi:flavin reductase (DIM6/NTAB) family NADH-FMN oxidoreductase RutF
MTSPILEPKHLRSCLSRFVTGVAVVSYQADGELRGLTVNSFTSVSLDPPLILVSLARHAKAVDYLSDVPFTINVLKASQFDLAMQFAGRPRPGLRVGWEPNDDGLAPTLTGALATFQCRPWHAYDGGDHVLQLGEVVKAEVSGQDEPLLFDRGQFAMVGLSLFDNPRVIEAAPVIGGGIVRNQLVHHLAAAAS